MPEHEPHRLRRLRRLRPHDPPRRARGRVRDPRGRGRSRSARSAASGPRAPGWVRADLLPGGTGARAEPRAQEPSGPPPSASASPARARGARARSRRSRRREAGTSRRRTPRRAASIARSSVSTRASASRRRRACRGPWGEPRAAVRELDGPARVEVTIAWELSWYRWEVGTNGSGEPRQVAKGAEVEELADEELDWNAEVDEEGRLRWLGRLVVNVDGGSRGNPGPAAIGVVVSSPEGEMLEELGEPIGEATNNVAEYRALLRGIERARELGATRARADRRLRAGRPPGARRVQGQGPRAQAAPRRGPRPRWRASRAGRSATSPASRTRRPTASSTRRSTGPDRA